MKIDNNFVIENHRVDGFEESTTEKNQIAMYLDNYKLYFNKADSYEFMTGMLGKKYMEEIQCDKELFDKTFQNREISILRKYCPKRVSVIIDDMRGDYDFVGICGIDNYGNMIASDTRELFYKVDDIEERQDLAEEY